MSWKAKLSEGSNNQSLPSLNLTLRKFTPKHLKAKRKKVHSTKKFVIHETAIDKIERERRQLVKPLKDVEQIMRKFDE